MICVTGAGGTVGSEVVRQLQAAGAAFRAAYFSDKKAVAARAAGIEAVIIDYNRPETLARAFDGCERLFLLGPTVPNQQELEINAVHAAKAAGVRHIVKQSVLGAEGETYSLALLHRSSEKAIESSGLAWTFLRPNSFMQNAVTFMGPTIRSDGAFYSSIGNAKVAHVDVRDIAAVAVKALTESGHESKAYAITGPQALSYDELASALTEALGRPIQHISIPAEDLRGGMLAAGVPDVIADRLLDLDRYLREGHGSLITDDIEQVTGQAPRRLSGFVQETAATGVWNATSEATK